MATWINLAAVAVFAALAPNQLPERKADPAEQDLAQLQGAWELTLPHAGGAIRSVQTIDGNTSIVDRYDQQGQLLHSHTAQFKLETRDGVCLLTFFDLVVTAGPQQGRTFKGPRSLIYTLRGDTWIEARGLLRAQSDEEPRLLTWKRVAKEAE